MRRACLILTVLAGFGPRPACAQEDYGAKGIFPVYVSAGHWFVYDKAPGAAPTKALSLKSSFLVIAAGGEELLSVAHSSAAYGGLCRERKPSRLRTAVFAPASRSIGAPIVALKAPPGFSLRGHHTASRALPNAVGEALYQSLGPALSAAAVAELPSSGAAQTDKPFVKIDFAARVPVAGLKAPLVLVTGAQVSSVYRRCLRLADGDTLVGSCLEMPHALMAESQALRFAVYDPGEKGSPLLLAYTEEEPLWGHERWVFSLRSSGAKLVVRDALDARCRESF
jgi:hypothetical protein